MFGGSGVVNTLQCVGLMVDGQSLDSECVDVQRHLTANQRAGCSVARL